MGQDLTPTSTQQHDFYLLYILGFYFRKESLKKGFYC